MINQKGQGVVEFAIILMIVVLVMIIILAFFAPVACACIYSNIVVNL